MTSQDVALVFDGSTSMETSGFWSIKNFTIGMINSMDVGSTTTHVCLVRFSMEPFVVFNLTAYFSSNEMASAIDALIYDEGATGTVLLTKFW